MATIDYKQKIKDYMNSSEVDTLYKSMLNNLFPELRESGDERIRKHLIGVVELYYGNTDEQEKKDCLDWLEKQGGQKPVDNMEQYIPKAAVLAKIERLANTYDKALDYEAALEDVRNFIDTLKGRYTWKPSDEQIGVIEAVINNRSFQRRHLDSLYEQLKKLREE